MADDSARGAAAAAEAPAAKPTRRRRDADGDEGASSSAGLFLATSASAVCGVCSAATSKYRCRCGVKYCSVVCFKKHKAEDACVPIPAERAKRARMESAAAAQAAREGDSAPAWAGSGAGGGDDGDEDAEEDAEALSSEQLSRIGRSASLRAALRDPHLQQVIRDIDSAGEAEQRSGRLRAADRLRVQAIQKARRDARFKDFVDELLTTVGVCERDAEGNPVFNPR